MNGISKQRADARFLGARSLQSVSLAALLASVTHAYDFGVVAIALGVVVIAVLGALSARVRSSRSRVTLAVYALLNLWIIGGFGIVGGFWNHTVKLVLAAAHGGAVPQAAQRLFMSPDLGSVGYEASGVLTFVAAVLAATFGYRFVREALGHSGSEAATEVT